MAAASALLGARPDGSFDPAFHRLLCEAVGAAGAPRPDGESPSLSVDLEGPWREYLRRRDALPVWSRERIDRYCERYCTQFWFQRWHFVSPSLPAHVERLAACVASLRFLLLIHPAAAAAIASGADEGREPLDRFAVRLFYSFSRHIEHSSVPIALRSPGTLEHHMALIAL
jgi:hypothetical protein